MTAEDNLDLYGRINRMPAPDRRTRIKELLTHLDLWDRRKEIVGKWSRGMKQKLAVARTLIHRPPLVFLDEPTAGFDPQAAAALHNDLTSLVEHEGVTVFLEYAQPGGGRKIMRPRGRDPPRQAADGWQPG